jgi:hypothetical protein
VPPPPPPPSIIADTGSTAHFGATTLPAVNKRPASNPLAIHNPNGMIMYSTHTAELDIPHLPTGARQVHIIPDLASHTLLSIGQLCDAGCDVTFNANAVIVLPGLLNPTGNSNRHHTFMALRLAPSRPAPAPGPDEHHAMSSAIGSATPAELVTFAHAAFFPLRSQRSPLR